MHELDLINNFKKYDQYAQFFIKYYCCVLCFFLAFSAFLIKFNF